MKHILLLSCFVLAAMAGTIEIVKQPWPLSAYHDNSVIQFSFILPTAYPTLGTMLFDFSNIGGLDACKWSQGDVSGFVSYGVVDSKTTITRFWTQNPPLDFDSSALVLEGFEAVGLDDRVEITFECFPRGNWDDSGVVGPLSISTFYGEGLRIDYTPGLGFAFKQDESTTQELTQFTVTG